MDKCHQDKCCLAKCYCDRWTLFQIFSGAKQSQLQVLRLKFDKKHFRPEENNVSQLRNQIKSKFKYTIQLQLVSFSYELRNAKQQNLPCVPRFAPDYPALVIVVLILIYLSGLFFIVLQLTSCALYLSGYIVVLCPHTIIYLRYHSVVHLRQTKLSKAICIQGDTISQFQGFQ